MTAQVVRIRGIDPLLFRDGRLFAAEVGALFAHTLSCPYPATVTGFLRTFIGNQLGVDWRSKEHIQRVLSIAVQAPILELNRKPVFHAPADAVVYSDEATKEVHLMPLRPSAQIPEGAGCDLPKHLVPLHVPKEVKPAGGYAMWAQDDLFRWLEPPRTGISPLPAR
ncbi:MAG: hypothetical protein C4335_08060 [Armatimonadota bacterium]